ncbi:uncharacterized protein LOC128042435 [Gossypium raimondii]|uniref:uncharacterized protein LOC128042435 n=1 Tax=Gossypium raimondii TaxID=29730 RepID=UPI00227C62D1|nr:uncharacterized protein LOC128042435 [Gossypium raimondii]
MSEYEGEFVRLNKYAWECILIENAMCKRFEEGLNEDIKLLVGILELKEFVVLVARLIRLMNRDKGTRCFSPKPQAISVASVGSVRDARLECKHYNKSHYGECRVKNGACFRCGSLGHYLRDCPEKSEKEKAQTTRPSNTTSRGRTPHSPRNVSGSCGVTKTSTVRSKAEVPTRASAIRTRNDAFVLDVITGTFFVYDTIVTALIDPGSTYSYGYSFSANLMLLPFDEFYVILVMDWITLHDAVKYVRKGCNTYIAYVLDTKVFESELESVLVVCEYLDVFPKELPRLPPIKEVEFAIELVPGTSPISIVPYRMALIELKEFKA